MPLHSPSEQYAALNLSPGRAAAAATLARPYTLSESKFRFALPYAPGPYSAPLPHAGASHRAQESYFPAYPLAPAVPAPTLLVADPILLPPQQRPAWARAVSLKEGPTSPKKSRSLRTDERKFQCPTCDLSFHRRHDALRHESVHAKERIFPCEYCHKAFSRLDAWKLHYIKVGHPAHGNSKKIIGFQARSKSNDLATAASAPPPTAPAPIPAPTTLPLYEPVSDRKRRRSSIDGGDVGSHQLRAALANHYDPGLQSTSSSLPDTNQHLSPDMATSLNLLPSPSSSLGTLDYLEDFTFPLVLERPTPSFNGYDKVMPPHHPQHSLLFANGWAPPPLGPPGSEHWAPTPPSAPVHDPYYHLHLQQLAEQEQYSYRYPV